MAHLLQKLRTTYGTMSEFSLPLIFGVIVALIWGNVGIESYQGFIHASLFGDFHFLGHKVDLFFLVNDVFMVLFFAIAAVEITRAFQPGNILAQPSKAINPLVATIGGILGPVGIFFLLVFLLPTEGVLSGGLTQADLLRGWGIPTATDIALAWLAASLILGKKHPAITFLLLLAIVDDAIGLVIIAVFYPSPEHPVAPIYLVLVVAAILIAWRLRRHHVKSIWPYIIFAGIPSWLGLLLAHLHPALAFVVVVPFMPDTLPERNTEDTQTPAEKKPAGTLTHFEHFFEAPVDLGLFFFGLANAGVAFSVVNNVTWIIFLSLLVGKAVGIVGLSWIASLLGAKPPEGITFPVLLVIGVIAGMGLTVALFITVEAYPNPILGDPAKMGALFSAFMAFFAWALARIFRLKKMN